MPYPLSNPICKHDLISDVSINNISTTSVSTFQSTGDIINALHNNNNESAEPQQQKPKLIAHVYTYQDDSPKPPPSNKLHIVGYCSSNLLPPSLLMEDTDHHHNTDITSFYIGVKRADPGKYRERLKEGKDAERAIRNSDTFAHLCKSLRTAINDDGTRMVAIMKADKYGRVNFLVPIQNAHESGADYAAQCHMGELNNVEKLLLGHSTTSPAAAAEGGYDDEAPFGQDNGVGNNTMEEEAMPWENNNDNDATATNAESNDLPWETAESTTPASDLPWEQEESSAPAGNDFDFGNVADDNNGTAGVKRPRSDSNDDNPFGEDATTNDNNDGTDTKTTEFHTDSGAAAADKFYSELTRSLGTRGESILFHMRNFNGWVKATQIAELDPQTDNPDDVNNANEPTKKKQRRKSNKKKQTHKLRVLDLACGKGGDLGKWTLHFRKIQNYVGIDVARGSLVDAAERARKMRTKLGGKCVFTCADLGADVPGRPKNKATKTLQKLSSWSLAEEDADEFQPPKFSLVRGGGISKTDKFDVVSIQFAIHYMMSTRERARRFFHTVSQLLDIGGNLIATTIDARVVLDHMLNMGKDYHFDDDDDIESDDKNGKDNGNNEDIVVSVGQGVCQLKFKKDIVRKVFAFSKKQNPSTIDEDLFGLEYTFTLVEGQDHAAGVGQAVDLPEWLTPLPVLTALAEEAGLTLEYASNFHEFYDRRSDPRVFHSAHNALYNMNVLNKDGSVSQQEWDISRMYMAVKFRKDRESTIVIEEENDDKNAEDDESEEENPPEKVVETNTPDPEKAPLKKKSVNLFMAAMDKAKASCSTEEWNELTGAEKSARAKMEMANLL